MTDEKVCLIVNLVSLRYKIQPDSTNLIALLEPALAHWTQRPPKAGSLSDNDFSFTEIHELVGLYLALNSLPHAERALALHGDSPMRIYSLSAVAHYAIVKKDLPGFNRFHRMLSPAAAEQEAPSGAVQILARLAECLATNNYPKLAADLFSEAKSLSSASRLTLSQRLDSLPFNEVAKSPIGAFKKARVQWREDTDQILSLRLFDLVGIGFVQHRSGFSSEAVQTLKRATAVLEDISVENRSLIFDSVFRLALGLNQREYAEKMLRFADKDELSDHLFSLAEAEIWHGHVQKGLARLDQISDEDLKDYRISSLAVALSESHRFKVAEPLIPRIEPDSLQEMVYPSLVTNLCHAGRSSEAQRYLARISDPNHRTELANSILTLRAKAPAPAPVLSDDGGLACGTGALMAQQFRKDVLFKPQKIVDLLNSPMEANPRYRHTTIRSIGGALGGNSSTSSWDFWQAQITDPLDLAFLHLGIAERLHSSDQADGI